MDFKRIIFLSLVLVFILSGCKNEESQWFSDDETYKLKVLYWDKESFFSTYGNFILSEFPTIEFEIVPLKQVYTNGTSPNEGLKQLIATEQPDVLFLNQNQFQVIQEQQALYPLRNILDKNMLNNIHSGVRELLEFQGEGEMYGVANSFNSSVLILNEDVFLQNGVSLPEGDLSWQEFIQYALRFQGTNVLGFLTPSSEPASLATSIGISEGLSYISWDQSSVTLDTEGWASIIKMIKPLYEEGVVNDWNTSYEPENSPFLKGEAAATIGDYSMYRMLIESKLPFQWRIIPLPSGNHSEAIIELNQIMAIYKESEHVKTAGTFIEYFFSEKMVRVLENTSISLPASLFSSVHSDTSNPFHFLYARSANIEATTNYPIMELMPDEFLSSFSPYYAEYMRKIMLDEIDVQEGLKQIQEYGNTLL